MSLAEIARQLGDLGSAEKDEDDDQDHDQLRSIEQASKHVVRVPPLVATWQSGSVLECVANISEGRDLALIRRWAKACGTDLLDVHTDWHHHRSVFTLVGEDAVRGLVERSLIDLDLAEHTDGVHPRLGIVDVVPFVPLFDSGMDEALDARQAFAEWAAGVHDIPCFLYGEPRGSLSEQRSLPDVRKHAWSALKPDIGPMTPHPVAGAICVGTRRPLVAFNIWMTDSSGGETVRRVARAMRSASVRTLALPVGDAFQVSMNLIEPDDVGPADVFAMAETLTEGTSATILRCELVGLVPWSTLIRTPRNLWATLDMSEERTIEHRLHERNLTD